MLGTINIEARKCDWWSLINYSGLRPKILSTIEVPRISSLTMLNELTQKYWMKIDNFSHDPSAQNSTEYRLQRLKYLWLWNLTLLYFMYWAYRYVTHNLQTSIMLYSTIIRGCFVCLAKQSPHFSFFGTLTFSFMPLSSFNENHPYPCYQNFLYLHMRGVIW